MQGEKVFIFSISCTFLEIECSLPLGTNLNTIAPIYVYYSASLCINIRIYLGRIGCSIHADSAELKLTIVSPAAVTAATSILLLLRHVDPRVQVIYVFGRTGTDVTRIRNYFDYRRCVRGIG